MKQVPHCGPTNIRRNRTKFSRPGDLASGVSASLLVCKIHKVPCPSYNETVHLYVLGFHNSSNGSVLGMWTERLEPFPVTLRSPDLTSLDFGGNVTKDFTLCRQYSEWVNGWTAEESWFDSRLVKGIFFFRFQNVQTGPGNHPAS